MVFLAMALVTQCEAGLWHIQKRRSKNTRADRLFLDIPAPNCDFQRDQIVFLGSNMPLRILPGICCLAIASSMASAGIVVSNLDQPFEINAGLQDVQFWAQRFVTDNSASNFRLDSVTLSLLPVESLGNFYVAIYSDSGEPRPLAELGTFSGDTNPQTTGLYTYDDFTGGWLSPNTSYWLVAGVSSGAATYLWKGTDAGSFTGTWSIPGTGSTSKGDGLGPSWGTPGDSQALLMSVSATAVPEVKDWGLAGGFLAALATLVRRKRTA
jgi:hypothetical protein